MQFIYKNNSGIDELEINKLRKTLLEYIAHCKTGVEGRNYEMDEASLCLVDDTNILNTVKKLAEKKKIGKLKYIIDIGIGGSNLGTKAIYDALLGNVDFFQPARFPKIIFLDTTDPEYLFHFTQFFEKSEIQPDEIIVNIISKSGGTTETAVNGEIVLDLLKNKFSNWKDLCVVTTDKNSRLWNNTVAIGIDVIEIPKKVGGRYSVFSPVGLFPLALCGIQIEKLLQGATLMRENCLKQGNEQNVALTSAVILYKHLTKGIAINDNFYFHMELESLGKWYRQLMGESTGKNGSGLTPTVSIGSVDLHSVVQLYLGGPKNKYTSFVYTNSFKEDILPASNLLTHIKEIQGKSVGNIMSAIQQGTITAYKNLNLACSETILENISEEEIGAYMQFKMMEIMFLGKLMNVNAFDQPQVELYKIETKRILSEK